MGRDLNESVGTSGEFKFHDLCSPGLMSYGEGKVMKVELI